jgi:outer membrane protein assembly factor BamB
MTCVRNLALGMVLLCVSMPLWADNWPQFRGPNGNGLTLEEQLPAKWDADTNIVWTATVPGTGWSSPIVWEDKVFISTAVGDESTLPPGWQDSYFEVADEDDEEQGDEGEDEEDEADEEEVVKEPPTTVYSWQLHCLDRNTGEVLWKRVARAGNPRNHTHAANTYASETPATDGEHIYVYFGMVGVFCYDFDGNLIWEKDLGVHPMLADWGTASSPTLAGDHVFLQIDSEGDSFLIALDKRTGEQRWRKPRDEQSNWSTPVVWKNKVRTELVASGKTVRSYDPNTGELLWSLRMSGHQSIGSPTGDSERIIIGSWEEEEPGYLIAVRAGAQGDITPAPGSYTSDGVLWMQKDAGPSIVSPLVYRDSVYILDNSGTVNCYNVETGAPRYQKERPKGARRFWASPWGYDGKVFCLDERGTTHVLDAGSALRVLGQNKIKDKFWASPAIAGGRIVLRGARQIYCVKNPD